MPVPSTVVTGIAAAAAAVGAVGQLLGSEAEESGSGGGGGITMDTNSWDISTTYTNYNGYSGPGGPGSLAGEPGGLSAGANLSLTGGPHPSPSIPSAAYSLGIFANASGSLWRDLQLDLPSAFGGGATNGTTFNYTHFLWALKQRRGSSHKADGFKRVLDFLNLYLTPVIILVGVAGNVMSFLVFSITHLTRLSSSVYLAALSVADTGFLLALSVVWLSRVGVPIFTMNGWCQCTVYFTYLFSFLSVWTVVSFTAERYIIVYHPLRKDAYCTRRKAKLAVCVLGALASVMYTFALWTSGVVRFDTQAVCMPLPEYYDVITIMTSIDTLISCVIPSMVIVVLNVRIILKLHRYQLKRAEFSGATVLLTSGSCGVRAPVPKPMKGAAGTAGAAGAAVVGPARTSRRRSVLHTSISTTGSMHIKFSSPNKAEGPGAQPPNVAAGAGGAGAGTSATTTQTIIYPDNCKRVMRSRSQFRTARMLLILSSVFVLLNLPSHVFRVQVFVQNFVGGGPKAPKARVHWKELFQLVYFLNFAINFFVYNACGRQFRMGLKRMCRYFACVRGRAVFRRVASLEKLAPPGMPGIEIDILKPNISPV